MPRHVPTLRPRAAWQTAEWNQFIFCGAAGPYRVGNLRFEQNHNTVTFQSSAYLMIVLSCYYIKYMAPECPKIHESGSYGQRWGPQNTVLPGGDDKCRVIRLACNAPQFHAAGENQGNTLQWCMLEQHETWNYHLTLHASYMVIWCLKMCSLGTWDSSPGDLECHAIKSTPYKKLHPLVLLHIEDVMLETETDDINNYQEWLYALWVLIVVRFLCVTNIQQFVNTISTWWNQHTKCSGRLWWGSALSRLGSFKKHSYRNVYVIAPRYFSALYYPGIANTLLQMLWCLNVSVLLFI